jgi:endonuclease YncB( thermonuclease family)
MSNAGKLIAALLVATAWSTPTKAEPASTPTAPATLPAQFVARCVGITDGDTLRVLYVDGDTKSEIKIRLNGIDAPEKGQPFGEQSKQALSTLAFGKDLTVNATGRDYFGRLLAWLSIGSTPINATMVKDGFAWWFRKYARDNTELAEAEADARDNRRGLWIDAAPVAPWEWRRKR